MQERQHRFLVLSSAKVPEPSGSWLDYYNDNDRVERLTIRSFVLHKQLQVHPPFCGEYVSNETNVLVTHLLRSERD